MNVILFLSPFVTMTLFFTAEAQWEVAGSHDHRPSDKIARQHVFFFLLSILYKVKLID